MHAVYEESKPMLIDKYLNYKVSIMQPMMP